VPVTQGAQRVVHALPWFAPESWGGTEQYVAALARSLGDFGWDSVVLAPARSDRFERYEYQGVSVVRWLPEVEAHENGSFAHSLRALNADVFHLHGWTPQCGPDQLAAAAHLSLATVVTAHVPSQVCATGTMLFRGVEPCTQVNSAQRCAGCWLESQNIPHAIARMFASIPQPLSAWFFKSVPGRLKQLPGARARIANRASEGRDAMQYADRIVAVCEWLHRAMLELGMDARRMVLCRQGLDENWVTQLRDPSQVRQSPKRLELAFVGRWDRVKGLDLLVRALRQMPPEQEFLLTMGVAAATDEIASAYRRQVIETIGTDARFELRESLSREAVHALIGASHALVVPSQWLETGPLVALEARALDTFVLGSAIGGLVELLGGDSGAQLVEFNDVQAWTQALMDLHARREQLALGVAASSIRSSRDVALDMRKIYADALLAATERRHA
jgi:glycosyltransferase involved in cell wall biosynthesis